MNYVFKNQRPAPLKQGFVTDLFFFVNAANLNDERTVDTSVSENLIKKLNTLNQIWVDGYNYHLMSFYAFIYYSKNEMRLLTKSEINSFEELSLLYLSKMFDKTKSALRLCDFIKEIRKEKEQIFYSSSKNIFRETETDLQLMNENYGSRISKTISKIRNIRNDYIAHTSSQKISEIGLRGIHNLSFVEINELYQFAHHVLNKYSLFLANEYIPKNKKLSSIYESEVKKRSERSEECYILEKDQVFDFIYILADLGNADYQNLIGCFYEKGKHTTLDLVSALKWYIIASKNGDRNAFENNITLRKKMRAEDIKLSESEASKWLEEYRGSAK